MGIVATAFLIVLIPIIFFLIGTGIIAWEDHEFALPKLKKRPAPVPKKSLEDILSEHRKEKTSRFREQTDEWTKEFEYLTRNEPVTVTLKTRAFIYESPDPESNTLRNLIDPTPLRVLGWRTSASSWHDWFQVQHQDVVGWIQGFMLFQDDNYAAKAKVKGKTQDLTEYEIEDTYHVYSMTSTEPIWTYYTKRPV